MLKSKLILGNWKMNLLFDESIALAISVAKTAQTVKKADVTVGICPSLVHIALVAEQILESDIWLGAQDCHYQSNGAHTGDVSAEMLRDVGCEWVLAGHSERRQEHQEANEIVRAKAEMALSAGLHAVVCVGEKQEIRQAGTHLSMLENQLRASLPDIDSSKSCRERLTVAYEPIWAIGTGATASTQDIEETHQHLRRVLQSMYGEAIPRILYGGSVNAKNALEILSIPVVDGVLVGGASLKPEEFSGIIKAAIDA